MIDLKHNRIIRGDVSEPIKRWAVWFKTPFGVAEDFAEAFKACAEHEIDPNLAMRPVPVAFSQNTYETHDP